jgi:exopolysaccharide biosynthesis polyprenyl glycosylphosphotransferase
MRRAWRVLLLEAVAAVAAAVTVVLGQGASLTKPVIAVLVLWVAFVYVLAVPGGARSPERFELVTRAFLVLGALAAATAVGVVQLTSIPIASMAVITATLTTAVMRAVRWRVGPPIRVILVGDRDGLRKLLLRWAPDPHLDIVGACVVGEDEDVDTLARELEVPVCPSLAEVPATVRATGADSVTVVPSADLSPEDVRRLTWALERTGTPLGLASMLDTFAPHRVRASTIGGGLVMNVVHTHRSVLLRGLKSLVDRVVGIVLLTLAAPVIGLLCLAVRLDSPGPALFRQRRIGLDGKPFTIYKLRTMHADAEAQRVPLQRLCTNEMLFKLKKDPRITRVGRLLRRSSLDELPQLINVAKGDMSLVGPRPPLPEEVARYDDSAHRRLAVRPGITGLWQVSGRSDLSWEESLALDLHYVDNWRFSDDVVIALRTFDAVFRSRGAY